MRTKIFRGKNTTPWPTNNDSQFCYYNENSNTLNRIVLEVALHCNRLTLYLVISKQGINLSPKRKRMLTTEKAHKSSTYELNSHYEVE